jgi:hypothetical protein
MTCQTARRLRGSRPVVGSSRTQNVLDDAHEVLDEESEQDGSSTAEASVEGKD